MGAGIAKLGLDPAASEGETARAIARRMREGMAVGVIARAIKDAALDDLAIAARVADAFIDAVPPGGPDHGRALVARAYVHCIAQELGPAAALLDRAAGVADARADGALRAEVNLNRVQLLGMGGDLEGARRAGEAALDGYTRLGDDVMAAHARINLGITLRLLGRHADAVAMFDRARPAFLSDSMRSGMIATNSAEALLELDRFADAERAFEDARRAFELGGDRHAVGIVEGNLADLLARQGRIDEALHRFEAARRALEAVGSAPDAARLLAEEAEALLVAGAITDARWAFDRAVGTLESAGLKRELARALNGRAMARARDGLRAEAAEDAERAARVYEELGGAFEVACARLNLVLCRAEHPDRERVLGLLDVLEERPSVLAAMVAELADLAATHGDASLAEELAARAERAAADAGVGPLRPHLLGVRARIALLRGSVPDALAALRESGHAAGAFRDSIRIPMIRATVADTLREAVLLRCELLAASPEPEHHEEAAAALDAFRARSIVDPDTPPDGQDARLRPELLECQRALHVLYGRFGRGSGDRELGRAIAELEHRQSELRRRIAAAGDAPRPGAAPEVAGPHGELLPPATAFVAFFVSRGGLGALIVRAGRVVPVPGLCPADELRSLIAKLAFVREQALLGNPSEARWRRVANEAYARTFLALEPHLEGVERVGLSKGGLVLDLPVRGLHDGDRYLIERFDIRESPSLTVAAHLAAVAAPTGPPAVIGVRDEAAPQIADELDGVASVYPDAARLGPGDATTGAVRAAVACAPVVHIATHGVLSPDRPLSSRIALTDGWLTARELASMVAPGSSVILGACHLGARSGSAAGSRPGFVDALLARRAREVICSFWALHDGSAKDMLVNVHRTRARSACTFAQALRESQVAMVRAGEHPARWAALGAHGVIA